MEFRFIDAPAVKAAAIPALFAKSDMEYRSVETLNWKDRFPYLPATSFALAWCRDGLMLHWKVTEDDVLAGVGEDLGHIWEDSCVEFFFAPAGDGIYYNFECNCIGKLYLGAGPGRADRQLATPEVLASIDRWASLGGSVFPERLERTAWETALFIPFTALYVHDIHSLEGASCQGNFYKCGGKGEYKHYVSLFPIDTEKPDFHRPEFFRPLNFCKF